MTSGQIIKALRKQQKMSQEELAKLTGYTDRSSIAKIETDKCELTESKIKLFAKALNTDPAVILNLQEQPEEIEQASFDIVGNVAAGYGRYAEYDDGAGKITIPVSWLKGRSIDSFFALRISGNSMYPLYKENDIVIVLKQKTLDYSGQICVVLYNDDMATLKRVEYIQNSNRMILTPINPNYEPIEVNGEELDHCDILGIPRILIRNI